MGYLDESLVAWYDMSTVGTVPNLAPRTVGTLDGTTTGLVASTDIVDGVEGGLGLQMTPTDYVTVSDHADIKFGTTDFSISLFISTLVSGANNGMLEKVSGSVLYEVIKQTNDKIRFRINDGSNQAINYGNTALEIGRIYHCVCVCERGENLRIYLDGDLDKDQGDTSSVGDISNAGDLTIGNAASVTSWNGIMDEAMFFDTALTQLQIQDLRKRILL